MGSLEGLFQKNLLRHVFDKLLLYLFAQKPILNTVYSLTL